MPEKLAIVIPVYNVEPYIADCLDSLIAQTYQDWVAYVVDDGSTDKSGSIIDKYKKDDRFIILHKENGGLSSARNFALNYIDDTNDAYSAVTFLDSDDWLAPDAYESLMSSMKEHNADIVFFGFKRPFSDGRILENKFSFSEGLVHPSEYFAAVFSFGEHWKGKNGSGGFVWNKIFKMECIRGYRFIEDRSYNEDEIFCLQVGLNANIFHFIDRSFVYYRQREGSLVRANDFPIKLMKGKDACLDYVINSSNIHANDIKKYICNGIINNVIDIYKYTFIFVDNFSYISKLLYKISDISESLFLSKEISLENYKLVKFIAYLYNKNISTNEIMSYIILYNTNVTEAKINAISGDIKKLYIITNTINTRLQKITDFSMFKYIKFRLLSKITFGKTRKNYKEKYRELKEVYKNLYK